MAPLPPWLHPGMSAVWDSRPIAGHPNVTSVTVGPVAVDPDRVTMRPVSAILMAKRWGSIPQDPVVMPIVVATVTIVNGVGVDF